MDEYNNYLGPDYSIDILILQPGSDTGRIISLIDNLDGSYAEDIQLTEAEQATGVTFTLMVNNNSTGIIHDTNQDALGDVNGDGFIDIVDALLVAQYYVGLNPPGFNPDAADVNCDGEVDIIDALLIAQYYVGIITTFEGCDPTPGPTNPPEPVTYELQAEDATWRSGEFGSHHAGYTGSGFVNLDKASGEWIEWSLNREDAAAACCNFR